LVLQKDVYAVERSSLWSSWKAPWPKVDGGEGNGNGIEDRFPLWFCPSMEAKGTGKVHIGGISFKV
jgi:hypothetical protein